MRRVLLVGLVGLAMVLAPALWTPGAAATEPPPAPPPAVAPAGLAQAGAGLAQAGGEADVSIIDFGFDAPEVSVPVGTRVTWTNTSGQPHTATDRGGAFDTQPIPPAATATVAMSVPGTYFYFCRINPSRMNATIVVEEGAEPAPVVRVQAVDDGNLEGETLRFDPPQLEVAAGTTLLVANVGGKPHTLTAEDGTFGTNIIAPGPEGGRFAGTNATVTLSEPGTFAFFCEIHPQAMKGEVTVTGAAAAAPPPPAAGPTAANLEAFDFGFRDQQLTLASGAEVTVQNTGAAPHTATFDQVEVDTGTIDPGGSASLLVPEEPGTYSYRCTIHPASMTGVMVVLGQGIENPDRDVTLETTPVAPGEGEGGGEQAVVAPPPTVASYGGEGAGRGVSTLVLVTGVLGAFLGGLGIGPFLARRRRGPEAPVAPGVPPGPTAPPPSFPPPPT
ncbi:MAG: hypothetical protein GEV08_20685 [Acidimicrobiia bacterium]|nr:hypothetical protein [Acidimicrobiia bacterium]